jgi:hypothetical protein
VRTKKYMKYVHTLEEQTKRAAGRGFPVHTVLTKPLRKELRGPWFAVQV